MWEVDCPGATADVAKIAPISFEWHNHFVGEDVTPAADFLAIKHELQNWPVEQKTVKEPLINCLRDAIVKNSKGTIRVRNK